MSVSPIADPLPLSPDQIVEIEQRYAKARYVSTTGEEFYTPEQHTIQKLLAHVRVLQGRAETAERERDDARAALNIAAAALRKVAHD